MRYQRHARGISATPPYSYLPHQMVMHLIYFVVLCINSAPPALGISQVHSPREIVTRRGLDFNKHFKHQFGTYVEAHEDPIITNTNRSCTYPGVYIGTTGNIQGTPKVFDIKSGKVKKPRSVTAFNVPDRVIDIVDRWGKRSKMEDKKKHLLEFLDRKKRAFDWDNDDLEDEVLPPEKAHPEIPAQIPGIDLASEQDDTDDVVEIFERTDEEDAFEAAQNAGQESDTDAATAGVSTAIDLVVIDDVDDDVVGSQERRSDIAEDVIQVETVPDETPIKTEDTDPTTHQPAPTQAPAASYAEVAARTAPTVHEEADDIGDVSDVTYNVPTPKAGKGSYVNRDGIRRSARQSQLPQPSYRSSGRYKTGTANINLHNRRFNMDAWMKQANIPKYNVDKVIDGTIHINLQDSPTLIMSEEEKMEHVLGIIMIQQFSLKAGLKEFGTKGEEAVTKELKQQHDMETYFPLDPTSLSKQDRADALSSLMFLTQKRDGRVKARGVADGSKQRRRPGYKKEDAASPTVSNEGVMITGAIEAHEGRDVVTFDIPGAYLHALSDKQTIMLLKGPLAELMVMVDPKIYRKYVTYDSKGVPLMYAKMNKALYGLLRSALLFYRKLVGDLEAYGFKLNPHDLCVANAMINGKQMTVTWHVDDLKVSHMDPWEVTKFGNYLAGIYGEELTAHRGKVHDYLGMDFDYSETGKFKVSMIKYLDNVLTEFPEVLTGSAATPAADHLFKVREDGTAKLLDESEAQIFHHTTAQLLFLSTRARRDIQLAVAFLTTRVKAPDLDDWGKLRRCLLYLKGTKYMKLTITVENLNSIKWWIDASDRTHMDMKGHSGYGMSFGKGAVLSYSQKQKINTKSSTESELVGMDAALSRVIWGLYFTEAQGYTIDQNIAFQDNQATMRLEVNGAMSQSRRTKHINARYFMVKDRIDEGELEVQYCPTKKMWTDVLNKPEQGAKFRLDRAELMNVPVDYDDDVERRRTHPKLLSRDDQADMVKAQTKGRGIHHRSVLGSDRIGRRIGHVMRSRDQSCLRQ